MNRAADTISSVPFILSFKSHKVPLFKKKGEIMGDLGDRA